MTTPRPPSFAAEFKALRARVRTLEATRRGISIPPVAYFADNGGNVVVAADGLSGVGLGRPFLPIPFINAYGVTDSVTGWPLTTSASFVDLLYAGHQVQHAYVMVMVTAVCGAGTTGEIQLLDDVDVIGDVQSVAAGSTTSVVILQALHSVYSSLTTLHLQARRTVGTGNVWVNVTGAWGVQTPLA